MTFLAFPFRLNFGQRRQREIKKRGALKVSSGTFGRESKSVLASPAGEVSQRKHTQMFPREDQKTVPDSFFSLSPSLLRIGRIALCVLECGSRLCAAFFFASFFLEKQFERERERGCRPLRKAAIPTIVVGSRRTQKERTRELTPWDAVGCRGERRGKRGCPGRETLTIRPREADGQFSRALSSSWGKMHENEVS